MLRGTRVIKILLQADRRMPKYERPTRVMWLAGSDGFLISEEGLLQWARTPWVQGASPNLIVHQLHP